jgi:hypothetical protein
MKKLFKILLTALCFLIFIYLCLPIPEIPPLPDSLKSTEPGDTVEIPGVSAFYTDISRGEVVGFYQKAFSRSSFLNLPLPVIVLNHPPEYGKQAIRATTETTFLYELVHPFRDSFFINGWDPAEHPEYKKAKDPTQVIKKNGRFYQRKITLRLVTSSLWARILVFSLSLLVLAKILIETKRSIISLWRTLR